MKPMCIILSFAILFAGCYSSELINLNGENRQESHSIEQEAYSAVIEYVVTNDGKQYHFDTPPTLVKDGIGKIRSTEISYVIMKDGTKYMFEELTGSVNDTAAITPPIGKIKTNSTLIEYVITKDGTGYIVEGTTAVVNDTIVGVLKAKAAMGFADDPTAWVTVAKGTPVSIPLSDVAQVKISESIAGLTALVVLGGIVAFLYIISAVLPPTHWTGRW
jgi:hypothetical protein